MPAHHLSISVSSAVEMTRLAALLATKLAPGDVILLTGDVGAGKTHFARSLIQSVLVQPEDVPSPTFTLVQTYDTQIGEIWHADLYRLTSVFEVEELGLIDAFDTSVCLVEWPDRLGPLTPANALSITLTPGDADNARQLMMHWEDPKWTDKLGAFQA